MVVGLHLIMAPSWLSPNQTGQNSSQPIEWHKESGLSERNSSEDGLENGSLLTKWNKSSNLSELSSIDDQYTSLATIGLCDAVIIGTAMGVSLHIGGHDKSAFVGVLIDAVAGFVSMAASGMLSAKSEEYVYPGVLQTADADDDKAPVPEEIGPYAESSTKRP